MFTHLGTFLVRRRRSVLLASALLLVVAGVFSGGAFGVLRGGGFEDPDSESSRAEEIVRDELGRSETAAVLVIEPDDPVASDGAVGAVDRLDARVTALDGVAGVRTWHELGRPEAMVAADGDAVLAFVVLDPDVDDDERDDVLAAARAAGADDTLTVAWAGSGPVFAAIGEQVGADLAVAQLIAIPITLVLLLVIFRGVVAATVPLLIGMASILGTLLILYLIGSVTDVSIYAINLTTALGLGLGIDFSLFIVSRFREELDRGSAVDDAVVATVATAGRTVAFSGATTMISLSALVVFPLYFLRSFAYAGAAAVGLATAAAVVTLPALLATVGTRINALAVRRPATVAVDDGRLARIARAVMRRPATVAIVAVMMLVLVGAPFLRAEFATPDHRVLPAGVDARDANESLRTDFATVEANAFDVVAPVATDPDTAAAVGAALSRLDHVARVDGPGGVHVDGVRVATLAPGDDHASAAAARWSVVPEVEPMSRAGQDLVHAVRDLDAPVDLLVGGAGAQLVDTKAAIADRLPLALGLIATASLLLLFALLRSVVLPVKAVVLNLLSLTATYGSMVWIFQDGNGAELLGFTPTGAIDTTMPILMFCVAFGLSIDYEVFLLSRIREERDAGADTATATVRGLQRTGGIVTASALLLAVTFGAFAAGGTTFIKLFGIGLAVAVLVDAFIVRLTLVPAIMALLGDRAWWAPRTLGRRSPRSTRDPEPCTVPVGATAGR